MHADANDLELAEYFEIRDNFTKLAYDANNACNSSLKSFLALELIQIKLIDNYAREYVYDLKVDVKNSFCEKSNTLRVPAALNNLVLHYTLTTAFEFTFPSFISGSLCCDVNYSYRVNHRNGWSLVKKWDSKSRTFTFESDSLTSLNNDINREYQDFYFTITAKNSYYQIKETEFTLRVLNPCQGIAEQPTAEQPRWCPPVPEEEAEKSYWMKNLRDITVYDDFEAAYKLFPLGKPEDTEVVKIELGAAANFVTYIEAENTLKV